MCVIKWTPSPPNQRSNKSKNIHIMLIHKHNMDFFSPKRF